MSHTRSSAFRFGPSGGRPLHSPQDRPFFSGLVTGAAIMLALTMMAAGLGRRFRPATGRRSVPGKPNGTPDDTDRDTTARPEQPDQEQLPEQLIHNHGLIHNQGGGGCGSGTAPRADSIRAGPADSHASLIQGSAPG